MSRSENILIKSALVDALKVVRVYRRYYQVMHRLKLIIQLLAFKKNIVINRVITKLNDAQIENIMDNTNPQKNTTSPFGITNFSACKKDQIHSCCELY